MILSRLPKTTKRGSKRVGRGYGSGKGGHTVGRGTKGQKSRSKVPLEFEGIARGGGFYKRLPFLRGKGKLKPNPVKPVGINIKYLNILPKNTVVTFDTLIKYNIVTDYAKKAGVKILGDGSVEKSLTVTLPVTKGAQRKIEKAGGSIRKEKVPERKQPVSKK